MTQRFILWDFDGTLARCPGQWSGALLETVTRFEPSFPCGLSQLRPHMQAGFPWHNPERGHEHLVTSEDWWAEVLPIMERAFMGVGIPQPRAAELAREAKSIYLSTSRWTVFDDVVPTLSTFREAGWNHAILSNHVPELDSLVSSLGLRPHFDGVFSSAALGYEKPNALAFRRALEALGNPQHVWMVGDSYDADVIGAERLGIPAVLVRSRNDSARYHCESLTQLPQIVGA